MVSILWYGLKQEETETEQSYSVKHSRDVEYANYLLFLFCILNALHQVLTHICKKLQVIRTYVNNFKIEFIDHVSLAKLQKKLDKIKNSISDLDKEGEDIFFITSVMCQ